MQEQREQRPRVGHRCWQQGLLVQDDRCAVLRAHLRLVEVPQCSDTLGKVPNRSKIRAIANTSSRAEAFKIRACLCVVGR